MTKWLDRSPPTCHLDRRAKPFHLSSRPEGVALPPVISTGGCVATGVERSQTYLYIFALNLVTISTSTPRKNTQTQHMYWVYILTNKNHTTLYVGVTNNIQRRLAEHISGELKGFSSKYQLTKLVFAESAEDVWDAIAREKQIKRWRREKKVALIESMNPKWLAIPVD